MLCSNFFFFFLCLFSVHFSMAAFFVCVVAVVGKLAYIMTTEHEDEENWVYLHDLHAKSETNAPVQLLSSSS